MRASFHYAAVHGDKVFIVDNDGPTTVTNDAEAVVENVFARYPLRRIIYLGTDDVWMELKHSQGIFLGFAPYNEWTPR